MSTLDLNKSLEFFDPSIIKHKVHIIGCGAVGSQLAVLLARLGVTDIVLWDDDVVASHNLANQDFYQNDIGRLKVDCVRQTILAINPNAKVSTHSCRWTEKDMLGGYIFLCVDSIAPRQQIARCAKTWMGVKAIFDFRMGLTSGQFYCVSKDRLDDYMNTMQFTDEEADKATPKSACNYTLSVAYSIWAMLGYGVSAAVRYWSGEEVNMTTIIDLIGGVVMI